MELKIDLTGLLDEIDGDLSAIPYLLKLHLREIENLPIDIDPSNVRNVEFTSETNEVEYRYHVDDDRFYFSIELTPKE